MAPGKSFKESAQLGTVAATYALEHLGGQSHAYTMKEFGAQYAEHSAAGSLNAQQAHLQHYLEWKNA